MCIGLVAHFAEIWLVRCVNMHVFFPVAAVCKPSVAAFKLTLEGFFSCLQKIEDKNVPFQKMRVQNILQTFNY